LDQLCFALASGLFRPHTCTALHAQCASLRIRRAGTLFPRLALAMTDRFSAEDLPLIDDLGAWLRRERERAGVTLETIATRTKVARTLLEALERNDVSRWPAGIFRRSFVRGYAAAVGLDTDYVVALFLRAFPDPVAATGSPALAPSSLASSSLGGATQRAAGMANSRPEAGLRLTLAPEVSRFNEALARLGAATTDLMAPITLALPSGLLGGLSMFWIVLAVVAVLYLTVGTLVLGTTPGLWMMQKVGWHPLGARRLWGRAGGFGAVEDEAPALETDAAREPWGSHLGA
jgi:transcriptional regulator with XRE-family HTH domain